MSPALLLPALHSPRGEPWLLNAQQQAPGAPHTTGSLFRAPQTPRRMQQWDGSCLPHLDAEGGRLLLPQDAPARRELLADEEASQPSLQPHHEGDVGGPQALTVVR